MMLAAAMDPASGAGQATTFSATVGSGQEFVWRTFQFNDEVEELSNLIFNKTLRGMATFLVCGNNVARLIKQLKPQRMRFQTYLLLLRLEQLKLERMRWLQFLV